MEIMLIPAAAIIAAITLFAALARWFTRPRPTWREIWSTLVHKD